MRWHYGLPLFVFGLAVLSMVAQEFAPQPTWIVEVGKMGTQIGEEAPDFSIQFTDGRVISRDDLLRKGIVVITSTSSWYHTAIVEAQQFGEIFPEMKDKPVTFLSISVDPADDDAKLKILKDHTRTSWFYVHRGHEGVSQMLADYHMNRVGITYIIDRDGTIRYRDASLTAAETLRKELTAALRPQSTPRRNAYGMTDTYLYEAQGPETHSLLLHTTVLAYYGHPSTPLLGILGEYATPEALARAVSLKAKEYDVVNGDKGTIGAFHFIFAVVHPNGSVGLMEEEMFDRYLKTAKEQNMLVILDHQIGAGTVENAVRSMLPYLHHENVHLAIDPEWHTKIPGKEIGSVTGSEINAAQNIMQRYMEEQGILGKKMLIVHQFKDSMIINRPVVRSDFSRVDLVHDMDGFGGAGNKISRYVANVQAKNIPLKAFKLFYPRPITWSYDTPLLSPKEVMNLKPKPSVVIYQ